MEPTESIGQRIKQVRGELSQKAFGLKIGLSQTAVTALENDQSEPRLGTFNAIIEAFAVDPEWLRTGAGRMKTSAPANQIETATPPAADRAKEMEVSESDESPMLAETNNNPWFHRYHALLDLMKATGSITSSQHGALKKSKGSVPAATQPVAASRIFVAGYRRYETVMFINRDTEANRFAWVDAALDGLCATPYAPVSVNDSVNALRA